MDVVNRIERECTNLFANLRLPARAYLGRHEVAEYTNNRGLPQEEEKVVDGRPVVSSLAYYKRVSTGNVQIIPVDMDHYLRVEAD